MPPAATTSAGALQNLQGFEGSQQSASQLQSANNTALGVPAAQQQVSGLRGAINNTTQLLSQVAPSVMNQARDSLMSTGQGNAVIAADQAPLNTSLASENTDYNQANSDLTNATNQANTLTTNDLTGQQNQLSYLQGIYSDLNNSEQQATANKLAQDQLNASIQASKESANATVTAAELAGGGNSGGTSSGGTTTTGNGYTGSQNSVGGYEFTGPNGKPVTMGQALQGNNSYSSPQALVEAAGKLLAQSGSANDRQIANAISSGNYTPTQLEYLFPQVFGG
jgi:hypothetical protein